MADKSTRKKINTRSDKQIYTDNRDIINFYMRLLIFDVAIIFFVLYVWPRWSFTKVSLCSLLMTSIISWVTFALMWYFATPKIMSSGHISPNFIDLTLPGAFSETLKDIMITTIACHLLVILISSVFWIVWMFVPCRIVYIIWIDIISPYMSASSASQGVEMKSRKQRRTLDKEGR
ncbi:hypothetical protein GJ496_001422 [Pomphorhynchus laevis]|nr:hypothetical protein GJ496_001422 [Pomphorhynchus laevis]